MARASTAPTHLVAPRRSGGFHRVGAGWADDRGEPVRDRATVQRLRALVIPPAWTHVWAAPDPSAAVQATGIDARGRTQYRYSAEATRRAARDKFAHVLDFAAALPALRAQVAHDLVTRRSAGGYDPAELAAVSTAVRLLDLGLFRVGNERYTRDNHTYGLTTLTRAHVAVRGSSVTFDYVGKEHRRHVTRLQDPDSAKAIRRLLRRPDVADAPLFLVVGPPGRHAIHSADINAYLHTHTEAPATAKMFRTWGGTVAAALVSAGAEPPGELDVRRARSQDTVAIAAAAALLGDTVAVTKASYVHPRALAAGRTDAVRAAVDAVAQRASTRDVSVLIRDEELQQIVLADLRRDERPDAALG